MLLLTDGTVLVHEDNKGDYGALAYKLGLLRAVKQ